MSRSSWIRNGSSGRSYDNRIPPGDDFVISVYRGVGVVCLQRDRDTESLFSADVCVVVKERRGCKDRSKEKRRQRQEREKNCDDTRARKTTVARRRLCMGVCTTFLPLYSAFITSSPSSSTPPLLTCTPLLLLILLQIASRDPHSNTSTPFSTCNAINKHPEHAESLTRFLTSD